MQARMQYAFRGLIVVLALAVAGCDANGTTNGSDRSRPRAPAPSASVRPPQVIRDIKSALRAYWSGRIDAWEDPSWHFYRESAPPRNSACRTDTWDDNSFYCPTDTTLYIDLDLAAKLSRKFGVAGEVWLMAHEYGHHVHEVTASVAKLNIGEELGADCEAGVFASALDSDEYPVSLDPGDAHNMLDAARDLADADWDDGDSWFDPSAHGGPIQRAAALATGVLTSDPDFCKPYAFTDPIETINVGQYHFRLPPATTATLTPNGSTFLIRSSVYPNLKLDATAMTVPRGSAVQALESASAPYFEGSTTVRYIGAVEDFVRIGGNDTASRRYEQVQSDGSTVHGALVLITAGDGTAMVLDAFVPGVAPQTDEEWLVVGNFAFSALWGITE